MSTQSDFQGLVTRIGVATDKLEVAVGIVETGSEDVAQAVVEAQQAAQEAKDANTSAQQAKTDSATSAATATQKANEATQTANELKALAPFQEAPKDGQTYGRKDGAWSIVTGGGGAGTVTSVNGKAPNAQGEVTLTPTDIGAATASHTHSDATNTAAGFMTPAQVTKLEGIEEGATVGADWNTNVANKPTIPTQGITSIQAGDNITIDNTNPLSPIISATGGGGGSSGYPVTTLYDYDGNTWTSWPSTNPNQAADLSKVGGYIGGYYLSNGKTLTEKEGLEALPAGNYFFTNISTDVPNITGSGIVEVVNGTGTTKNVRVITMGSATELPQEWFPVVAANGTVTWKEKNSNPEFLFPTYENGWEFNFGTSGSPNWVAVDYWPVDFNHAIPMLSFRRRGSPYAGASSAIPSTGQDGSPISWNQMFSTNGYIQYVPAGKYWFTTTSFSNTTGGAALTGKTGYITVECASSGVGLKRATAVAYDSTTNIPSVYYWKSDGTWNKAT